MHKALRVANQGLAVARLYLSSLYGGYRYRQAFESLETYCMFVGYPRSGSSLVGALLDAHPNMIVAHELHALRYLYARFSRQQIFYLLLQNSRERASQGRTSTGYSYAVPDQWQGKFGRLEVIGDKKAWGSTGWLRRQPDLLRRLRDTIGLPIKFIHVVRNPYDNISTMAKRHHLSLQDSIELYFRACETIDNLKQQIGSNDFFEIRHESFVEAPRHILQELCHFLGVDAPDDYLTACASIVYRSPHKSRHKTVWENNLRVRVQGRIGEFAFLEGYSFKE